VWLANFEDGRSVGGVNVNWTDLPKDKRITGVQLVQPNFPKLFVCLKNYDKYFFAQEAMAMLLARQGTPTAEILGGMVDSLGVCTEVRLEMTGNLKIRTYPISEFIYAKEILHAGKVNGKARVETTP